MSTQSPPFRPLWARPDPWSREATPGGTPEAARRGAAHGSRTSFSDYVREYDLQRTEGLLLRHLNGVFKVLAQTVPDGCKSADVLEMEVYLGAMIRQVDSSLLDEWERMQNPAHVAAEGEELRPPGADAPDVTRDRKGFMAALRNRIFTLLASLDRGGFEEAALQLAECGQGGEGGWTAEALRGRMEAFRADHRGLRLDPEGRNLRHTVLDDEDGGAWRVQQMLVDPDGFNDWMAEFRIDLPASRARSAPVLELLRLDAFHA